MKKVIGLFLVILISSTTVFAQSGNRQGKKGDPSKRSEKMIEELKLDDKQAAEFRKIETEFRAQMEKEREAIKVDRSKMREKNDGYANRKRNPDKEDFVGRTV